MKNRETVNNTPSVFLLAARFPSNIHKHLSNTQIFNRRPFKAFYTWKEIFEKLKHVCGNLQNFENTPLKRTFLDITFFNRLWKLFKGQFQSQLCENECFFMSYTKTFVGFLYSIQIWTYKIKAINNFQSRFQLLYPQSYILAVCF